MAHGSGRQLGAMLNGLFGLALIVGDGQRKVGVIRVGLRSRGHFESPSDIEDILTIQIKLATSRESRLVLARNT